MQAVSSSTGNGSSTVTIQRPTVFAIDWTEHATTNLPTDGDEGAADTHIYDIVLLTDCVFSVELVPDLMATILKHSGPKSTIICCHEIRDEVLCTG